jgi:hypothetical protein
MRFNPLTKVKTEKTILLQIQEFHSGLLDFFFFIPPQYFKQKNRIFAPSIFRNNIFRQL